MGMPHDERLRYELEEHLKTEENLVNVLISLAAEYNQIAEGDALNEEKIKTELNMHYSGQGGVPETYDGDPLTADSCFFTLIHMVDNPHRYSREPRPNIYK